MIGLLAHKIRTLLIREIVKKHVDSINTITIGVDRQQFVSALSKKTVPQIFMLKDWGTIQRGARLENCLAMSISVM
jgi:hypothetical protein